MRAATTFVSLGLCPCFNVSNISQLAVCHCVPVSLWVMCGCWLHVAVWLWGWIEQVSMGEQYLSPPPFDLAGSHADSSVSQPLVFVLSPGSDPMAALLYFADTVKKKVDSISLGQGQASPYGKLIVLLWGGGETPLPLLLMPLHKHLPMTVHSPQSASHRAFCDLVYADGPAPVSVLTLVPVSPRAPSPTP